MQPLGERNRCALAESGRRSRYGFCFFRKWAGKPFCWSVCRFSRLSEVRNLRGFVAVAVGMWESRAFCGSSIFPQLPGTRAELAPGGILAEVARNRRPGTRLSRSLPLSNTFVHVLLCGIMMSRATALPERWGAHESSFLSRNPDSIEPILPSPADATDGIHRDSATDRPWPRPAIRGIAPDSLCDSDSTAGRRTGYAETRAAARGSGNAG